MHMKMNKLCSVESSREHYHAGATVVQCIDCRLQGANKALLEVEGIELPDIIQRPGGAKALAALAEEGGSDGNMLSEVLVSIALHKGGLGGAERARAREGRGRAGAPPGRYV
jgi:hypothetical protein